jgi:Outer membrane lipoprotein-sorting protein
LTSKFNLILLIIFFQLFFINYSQADVQEKLLKKYKTINTLHFDFTQNIGDKVEFGDCYIKYPLLMKCYYPKKKKSIISNGKRFVIVKKRYKKIYSYP